MKVDVNGVIIPNDDKWAYDWMEWDAACPRDITDAIDRAGGDELNVYVNSGGGDFYSGMEMYSALRAYTGGVKIHVMSYAYSAASLLPCAGHCDSSPGGLIMLHQVSCTARGNSRDMQHASEALSQHDEAAVAVYMEKTGKTREEILDMMYRETYLTARDATELGLIDGIAEAALRPVAATVTMLSPEAIEKIRTLRANPPQADDFLRKTAKAKLDLLKLGGK